MLSLALFFVLVLLFFSVLFYILITSLGEKVTGLCARAFVCLFCTRYFILFFFFLFLFLLVSVVGGGL